MTTQERLREAAKYLRTQYPRPCSGGMFVDHLMDQAANEMDNWIVLLADAARESATAQGLRELGAHGTTDQP
jgi:hypothetical protein